MNHDSDCLHQPARRDKSGWNPLGLCRVIRNARWKGIWPVRFRDDQIPRGTSFIHLGGERMIKIRDLYQNGSGVEYAYTMVP